MANQMNGIGATISVIGDRLRNSYWFVPALMMAGAAVLAFTTISVDDAMDLENNPWLRPFVYSGGPDGAREVLGVIAGSMIGVAGVVFSITIVSLQLASSQFGPRMLANFMRDRGNQITLGTFVSTFLYSLLVLRTIRTTDITSVSHVSVTVALILAIASLSVLIYFIHHISTTIQAPNLIDAIANELRRSIDHMFPDLDQLPFTAATRQNVQLPADFDDTGRIDANSTGYVQVVDLETLVGIAKDNDLIIRLPTRPGRFVVNHTPFAHAYPASRVTDEVRRQIADTVVTGARRTSVQDIEFPIKQLAEIAVRALSPGINDPFTASTCVDQIGAGLCRIAGRAMPPTTVLDEEDRLRIVNEDPVTFPRLVGAGFDQIRQCADFHAPVYAHMLDALTRIAGCVNDPSRLGPLLKEARLVVEAAERKVEAGADLEGIQRRYDELVEVTTARRRG